MFAFARLGLCHTKLLREGCRAQVVAIQLEHPFGQCRSCLCVPGQAWRKVEGAPQIANVGNLRRWERGVIFSFVFIQGCSF